MNEYKNDITFNAQNKKNIYIIDNSSKNGVTVQATARCHAKKF